MKINPADIRTLIHIVTRQTGTPVHDEDLEQDVAVRALEAAHRLAGKICHPKALLKKIVHDTVHDHWRRRRRACEGVAGVDDIDERFLARAPELESEVDRQRRIETLHRALDELPAAKRALLDLFYVQDRSIAEIARLQNRSISAVKMDLTRCRRIVRAFATKKSRRPRQIRPAP